jgi:hypothetical protein
MYVMYVKNTIGWGTVIYAILAFSWTGFVLYGQAASPWSLVIQLLILTVVTTIAARSLNLHHWIDIAPYSFTWAGVAMALDVIYKVPFLGWFYFADWTLWVGYALIIIVPLITARRPDIVR